MAAAGQAATALASQLESDLQALMEQGKELEKEELDQRVQEIEARSAEAGTNQASRRREAGRGRRQRGAAASRSKLARPWQA